MTDEETKLLETARRMFGDCETIEGQLLALVERLLLQIATGQVERVLEDG